MIKDVSSSSTENRATARTWWGLAVLLLPALLTSMDLSVLFVAGPAIAEALSPSSTQWLWIMDIYGFVMASLLITMGSLGDRVGRRRMLLIGATLFGAASTLIALASSPALLIAARALLGIGGATLAPSTLSLIRGMFHAEEQRRIAVGAWTAAFAGGSVAGPIVGGVLLEFFWWGSVFLINVPVMVLLLVSAPVLIPEVRNPAQARFDLLGAALSLPMILSVVYGLKHAAEEGLDAVTVAALGTGAVLAVVFVRRQARTAHPLIDISLFRVPAFTTAVGANTVASLTLAGLGVLAFTFMQTVHGLSPLHAALWALPTFAGTLIGAAAAAQLAERIGAAPLLVSGLAASAAGLMVVATLAPDTHLGIFLTGYVLLTFGAGISTTIANSLILSTAPPGRAGAASGISETSNELGASLGIATLGTIAGAVYQNTMSSTAPDAGAATETVGGAIATAGTISQSAAASLLDTAFAAYTDGVNAAGLLGATLLAVTALAAAVVLRRRRTTAAVTQETP